MEDVIIVGGGVIGLSIAVERRSRAWPLPSSSGVTSAARRRGQVPAILPPGNLTTARTPEARLRGLSHSLGRTGPNRSRPSRESRPVTHAVEASNSSWASDGELADEIRTWRNDEVRIKELSPDEARQLEPPDCRPRSPPTICPTWPRYEIPDCSRCCWPFVPSAVFALLPGTPAVGFEFRGRSDHRDLHTERFAESRTFLCGGGCAWSRSILESIGVRIAVQPVAAGRSCCSRSFRG